MTSIVASLSSGRRRLTARYSLLLPVAVSLLLWIGCSSGERLPHTLLSVQDHFIVGALNAQDIKQAKRLTEVLLASTGRLEWPQFSEQEWPEIRTLLPKEVGAWRIGEDARVYRGKSLAEYETNTQLFKDYRFVEMVGSAYGDHYLSKAPLMQVDLYRMQTPLDAFGIYSLQRNVQTRPQHIGAEAIITPESLDAWKGPYYLKIQSWSIADAISEGMVRVAKEIFRRIDSDANVAPLTRIFPPEGKIPGTERFFRTYLALDQITLVPEVNVLQLSSETRGLLAEYHKKGSPLAFDTLVLFCIDYPSKEAAIAAFEFYRAHVQRLGPIVEWDVGSAGFIAPQFTGGESP